MSLKRPEFPRQSIESNADPGQITLLTGLFLMTFFAVLLISYLQMEMIRSSSRYLEDALAASGLAAALIDLEEYGKSHELRIWDARLSREQYCSSLKANLALDENWECENKGLISGPVTLEEYVIYNISGETVEYCRLENGRQEWLSGGLGQVRAPNGQVVERTGVYGEISYHLRGIWGLEIPARKGKLVDVVGET